MKIEQILICIGLIYNTIDGLNLIGYSHLSSNGKGLFSEGKFVERNNIFIEIYQIGFKVIKSGYYKLNRRDVWGSNLEKRTVL